MPSAAPSQTATTPADGHPAAGAWIVQVALDVPVQGYFDFTCSGSAAALVGRLVIVPFGRKNLLGVVVGVGTESEVPREKLKPVTRVLDSVPPFSTNDLALYRFCADYYHYPLGPIILAAIPPALRLNKKPAVSTVVSIAVTQAGREALAVTPSRAALQRELLGWLAVESSLPLDVIRHRFAKAGALLTRLEKRGLITRHETPVAHTSGSRAAEFVPGPALNGEQAAAVEAISNDIRAGTDAFAAFLLTGITGSGKTEVYLHAAQAALQRGRQVLMLVPEINLSPSLIRAVAERFPFARIAEMHSGTVGTSRLRTWQAAQAGEVDIVIGTRLAVFTPMPRLGLIVVDEEHDASFKQQEGFRYSARDIALFRANQMRCPAVLGSATPSLESLANIQRGRMRELHLSARASPGALLPQVRFIDLAREVLKDGLSQGLIAAIADTVARKEQALIFINRRGFSPALVCSQCGWMPGCKRCTARLVFHQQAAQLKCHHCGYQSRVPKVCPDCGSSELVAAGQGTERIEQALRTAFPEARMARVDRDSTRKRGSAEKIFAAAAKGEIDILVGTQMLSKGHDFPRLTLVGVVNADGAMFSADFRAAERLVAQLMQVAGRAGRAHLPGQVLIQTRFAQHPLYQAVAAHDYQGFAGLALRERETMHLPPYSYLAVLRAEARDTAPLQKFMAEAVTSARAHAVANGELQIWEPVPPVLARKAGFERMQLVMQSGQRKVLQEFLSAWLTVFPAKASRSVKWHIEVDPLEV